MVTNLLVAEDGLRMSGQEEDNPKETEGEVLEQAQNIETVGELKREKAAKKTASYKGEEVQHVY